MLLPLQATAARALPTAFFTIRPEWRAGRLCSGFVVQVRPPSRPSRCALSAPALTRPTLFVSEIRKDLKDLRQASIQTFTSTYFDELAPHEVAR